MYLIRIKSFAEKSDFTVFGIAFLYATHENKLIKQDAKNKKLYATGKIGLKELCGKCKRLYIHQKSVLNKLYTPQKNELIKPD